MTEQMQVQPAVRPPHTLGEVVTWALAAASVASAAIHFSVIGAHFHEAWYFGTFFAVVAWAQIAWAVGIVARPGRRMLLAGAVLQSVIVVVYFWSRTTGLPIGPEPWQPEAWGYLDVLSTGLEVFAAAGAFYLAYRPLDRPVSRHTVSAAIGTLAVVVAATTSAALAVTPAEMSGMGSMASSSAATSHDDGMGSMGPMTGGGKTSGSIGTRGMAMGSSATSSTMGSMTMASTNTTMAAMAAMSGSSGTTMTTMPGMNMGGGGGTTTTMPGMGDGSFTLATSSPAGDIMWPMMQMSMEPGMAMAEPPCTTTPTMSQRASAVSFVNTTVAATQKYRSLAAAKADGFVPVTPTGRSVVHYINWNNMNKDLSPGDALNPGAVQSLVYANTSTGPRLVAAMYLMPNGSTATPPHPGGCLEQWHLHTNLCFNSSNVVVGVTNSQGQCPAGSANRVTQPMIHVWLAPVNGGPLMVDAPDSDVVTAALRLPVADPAPERA